MNKGAIQVCTDGSELSKKAVAAAVGLAKELGCPLIGMTSVVGRPALVAGIEHESPEIQSRLHYVQEQAQAAGVECELCAEYCNSPYEGILEVASRCDTRFVVMASRGLGSLGSLLLGSETQKVLSAIDRPVLVIR